MKIFALARTLKSRAKARLCEWTDTEPKAFRACGILLLLLTATLVLPLVLVQIANGGGIFRELWWTLSRKSSGPDSGWGNMMVGYTLPAILALAFVGVVGMISGMIMLTLAKTAQNSPASAKPLLRRTSRYLLLGILLLLVAAILFPLFPWKLLGFSARRISGLTDFWWLVSFGMYFMEGVFVFPHAIAVFCVGYPTLVVATRIVSPREDETVPALVGCAQRLDRGAKSALYQLLDTQAKAYRACGLICFVCAAILVLPVLWFQATTVLFHKKMTVLLDIWLTGGRQTNSFAVLPTLLVLLLAVGAATFACVVGARMFAKAKEMQSNTALSASSCLQCKRVLQRFAWLLLVIFPTASAFTSPRWVSTARQLNLSKLFASIESTSWREANATFLRLQFFPLLFLGLLALALAISLPPQQSDSNSESR